MAEKETAPGEKIQEGGTGSATHLSTTSGEPPEDPKVYDEAYVKRLRDEAAENRTKKKAAEETASKLATKLLDTTVKSTCKALADPDDLTTYYKPEDLLGEDGLPDEHKILQAEADLIKRKPHLEARRPQGNIDQGGRGEEVQTFSFNDWLKNAAG